ncbi:natural killer cells antigen CD94-like [Talpa occidentalis]|uniref:natural killer cells antigen CD94-like n=1 Tax=Talpa occidentalis TaxID=50954 RepID=UPI001890155E|nr:natural killer cells antigen CD94-like [Talpa occidentalis]
MYCLVSKRPAQSITRPRSSGTSEEPSPHRPGAPILMADSGYSSCQERWIGYQCNCYFLSSEFKPWNESSDFCASQNSTLLQMDNRDELDFMKFNGYFYWIGVTYSANQSAWVWLNGSVVSQKLFPLPQTANTKNCVLYRAKGKVLYDDCQSKNRYICKQLT